MPVALHPGMGGPFEIAIIHVVMSVDVSIMWVFFLRSHIVEILWVKVPFPCLEDTIYRRTPVLWLLHPFSLLFLNVPQTLDVEDTL